MNLIMLLVLLIKYEMEKSLAKVKNNQEKFKLYLRAIKKGAKKSKEQQKKKNNIQC